MAGAGRSRLDELKERATPALDRAARRSIVKARELLDRAESRLDRGGPAADLPAGPLPPAGEEESYRRRWALLAEVEARGGRMSADEFRDLAQQHEYDPRGVGGFFSGPNSTMSRDGDTVELTPRGRREVQYWAPTFRSGGGDGEA
jgi:hypothetical protein